MGQIAAGAGSPQQHPVAVPGVPLLLRGQNVAVLSNLQKSLVQLLGLPWQLDICSFVFLENYAGLLIASFVKLVLRGLIEHFLPGLYGSDWRC